MKKIVIAHQKGGVGKSTVAINLAVCLKMKNYFTSIVDIDNQSTSTKCSNLCINENEITSQDFIIYDTPPYRTNKYKELFISSDIIIIPLRTGIADVLEVETTIEEINKIKILNPNIKACMLYNAVMKNSNNLKMVNNKVIEYGLPILETVIYHSEYFGRCLLNENAIFDTPAQKAKKNIEALTHEILSIL